MPSSSEKKKNKGRGCCVQKQCYSIRLVIHIGLYNHIRIIDHMCIAAALKILACCCLNKKRLLCFLVHVKHIMDKLH